MKIFIILLVVFFILFFNADVKLIVQYEKKSKRYANLGVYLFGVIKLIGLSFTENGINFLFLKIPYKKVKVDSKKIKFNKIKYILKNLDWKLENMKLFINIGFNDIRYTVFSVFFISTILSAIPAIYGNKIKFQNYYYKVVPIYNEKIVDYKLSIKLIAKNYKFVKIIFLLKNLKVKRINI